MIIADYERIVVLVRTLFELSPELNQPMTTEVIAKISPAHHKRETYARARGELRDKLGLPHVD